MKNKVRNIFWILMGFLFYPSGLLFAQTEWGLGVDRNGGVSFGIGSAGSGAGNVWGGGGWNLANQYGLPSGSIFGIVTNLLFWLLGLLGIFGVIGFVLSGILYLTSAGDDSQIERAKTAMKWSIVGLIVGLAGFVITQAVFSMLQGNNNKF